MIFFTLAAEQMPFSHRLRTGVINKASWVGLLIIDELRGDCLVPEALQPGIIVLFSDKHLI